MRAIAYIDGFNLYNRKLKAAPQLKWLNPFKLVKNVMRPPFIVEKAMFYTARVSPVIDPDAPARQLDYFAALQTVAEIEIVEGTFLLSTGWASLLHPPVSRPDDYAWGANPPNMVKVRAAREKGSDVNLASHLIRDAFQGNFEAAVVLSSDSDLMEPIRIVTQEAKKPVAVIRPTQKHSASLRRYASLSIALNEQHLAKSQFPDRMILADGLEVCRPDIWR